MMGHIMLFWQNIKIMFFCLQGLLSQQFFGVANHGKRKKKKVFSFHILVWKNIRKTDTPLILNMWPFLALLTPTPTTWWFPLLWSMPWSYWSIHPEAAISRSATLLLSKLFKWIYWWNWTFCCYLCRILSNFRDKPPNTTLLQKGLCKKPVQ